MADKSKIEWTEATWNPIRGTKGKWYCTKISPGCEHCYAERLNVRFGGPQYRVGADTLRLDEAILEQPLRWKRPRMIFPCSMTDLFHEDVPEEWILKVFQVMSVSTWHTYQVLTKRVERAVEFFQAHRIAGLSGNIWFGVTAENQDACDARIPHLLQIPAAVRFLSVEPMLGPLNVEKYLAITGQEIRDICAGESPYEDGYPKIDWCICGGESGPHARPMHPDWVRDLRDQCQAAKVSFHFKQHGEYIHESQIWKEPNTPDMDAHVYSPDAAERVFSASGDSFDRMIYQHEDRSVSYRVGKKAAGRMLDGRTWDEFPAGAYVEACR